MRYGSNAPNKPDVETYKDEVSFLQFIQNVQAIFSTSVHGARNSSRPRLAEWTTQFTVDGIQAKSRVS